jgi:hypothetical protein
MGIRLIGGVPFGSLNLVEKNGVVPNEGGGGFSPLDLMPSLWLDASDQSTLFDATSGGALVSADGTIARWQDKSGNGNHATQSTSGNRPIRKVANQNGLDAVRFDGSGKEMMLPDFLSGAGGTVLFVAKADADPRTSPNAGAPIGNWDTAGLSSHMPWEDGVIYFAYGTNSRRTVGNPVRSLALWNVYTVESSASGWSFRINGVEIYSDASNTVGWGSSPAVGAGSAGFQSWLGEIGEIVNIPNPISAEERAVIEAFEILKWGIVP